MEANSTSKPIPTHMQRSEVKSELAGKEVQRQDSAVMDVYTGPGHSYSATPGIQGDTGDSQGDLTSKCAENVQLQVSNLTLLSQVTVVQEDINRTEKVFKRQPKSSISEEVIYISTFEKWKKLSAPIILFVALGLIILIWGRGHFLQLLQWMEQLPFHFSLLVFVFLFTLVSFPFGFGYIILNMMAGYLYGVVQGQVIVMLSVCAGMSFAFLLCRLWLKDYARGVVTSNALQAVLRVVEGPHGFKVICLTRFTPIPFGLQNVLFAVSYKSIS